MLKLSGFVFLWPQCILNCFYVTSVYLPIPRPTFKIRCSFRRMQRELCGPIQRSMWLRRHAALSMLTFTVMRSAVYEILMSKKCNANGLNQPSWICP